MKLKSLIIAIVLVVVSVSVQAQYSVSINYGNVDWIPKSNKVLVYENIFLFQNYSFAKTGISVWQASCLTKVPNQYELGGLDYSKKLANVKVRLGFHGYFPKSSLFQYAANGNLIPNVGISTNGFTANIYQFWNYQFSDNYIVSNVVYKKSFTFGTLETGQYYNGKSNALSGSIAYSKSWPIYKKVSGFASCRWSFNETKTKLNEGNFIIVNIGLSI